MSRSVWHKTSKTSILTFAQGMKPLGRRVKHGKTTKSTFVYGKHTALKQVSLCLPKDSHEACYIIFFLFFYSSFF